MTLRRRSTGRFELPIGAAEAIDYFTPEGERSWAPGWDPQYPAGDPAESPGTVFTTRHGEVETVWVIETIDRTTNTASYSRLTSGHHAGTVRVLCEPRSVDRCVVSVEYDMTALDSSDANALHTYDDDHFEAMMNEWETRVTATLP